MSSGSITTAERGDNPSEDLSLSENTTQSVTPQSHGHILNQPTFQHAEVMKSMQKSVRPIAPAPTGGIGKPGGGSHLNPITGMPSGLLAQTFRTPHKGDTSHVGNIGSNLMVGAHSVSVTLPQQGIVQMNQSTLSSAQTVTPSIISTSLPTMNIIRGAPMQHRQNFPSHLPSGPVAASALSLAKTGPTIAAGSALLRPVQPTVQIPISANPGGVPTLLQTRPMLKAGQAPIVRSTSPAIGISMTGKHGEHIRPSYQYHGSVTPSSNPAIQITLRNTNTDSTSKPIITHTGHTLAKTVQLPQQAVVTQSKIIVSQSSSTMIPTSLVNIPKTAKISTQRPTVIPTILPTSVTEVGRPEAGAHQISHASGIGSLYYQSSHRVPTTTSSVATSNSSGHIADSRHDRSNLSNIQVPFNLPSNQESVYNMQTMYNHSLPNYPALMYNQNVRPTGINFLLSRPQLDQSGRVSVSNPVPNLSATLQTHPMTMASPSTVRLNQIMIDQNSRHPTISVPSYSLSSSSLSSVPHDHKTGFLGASLSETGMSSLASVATVASSIYSNTAGNHHHQQQPVSSSSSNPSASPRPTILRKRTNDNGCVVKKQLALMSDSPSPKPDTNQPQSNTSSPKTPAGENSQSSTDTALSSNDAVTPTQNSVAEIRVKTESSEVLENGLAVLTSVMASQAPGNLSACNSVEASPRKKPRKQLLHANEELKDTSSEDDEELEHLTEIKKEKYIAPVKEEKTEYIDGDGVRWTTDRCKPNISLLNFYNLTWKARNNHFIKATDVKPKEERRATVNELANQKGIVQKSSGWKLYHMAAQLEDLVDLEKEICDRVSKYQQIFEPKYSTGKLEEDYNNPYETAQANIQRCQLLVDQLVEAKSSMLKVLDHKPKITEIVNKHMSKRPIKKKERP